MADELGFESERVFHAQFQRYFRCAPAEYPPKHQRWAEWHLQSLKEFYGTDAIPEELLEPPWIKAWRTLGPRCSFVQDRRGQGFWPGNALLVNYLHEAVCRGAKGAGDVLAQLLLADLVRKLSGVFPTTDEELIADGVTEAFTDYLQQPKRFEPLKGSLEAYLRQVAWRKVRGLVRTEHRRKDKDPFPDKGVVPSPDDLLMSKEDQAEQERIWARRKQWLLELKKKLPPQDRLILRLMLRGERRCNVYAEVLGITDQSESQQAQKVEQAKHRLHERLKYWLKSHDSEG